MIIVEVSESDRIRWQRGEQYELDDLDALALFQRSPDGTAATAARLHRRHVRVIAELAIPQAMRGIA